MTLVLTGTLVHRLTLVVCILGAQRLSQLHVQQASTSLVVHALHVLVTVGVTAVLTLPRRVKQQLATPARPVFTATVPHARSALLTLTLLPVLRVPHVLTVLQGRVD